VLLLLVGLTLALELAIVARSPVIAPDGILFIAMARDLASDPRAALGHYDQHAGYPAMMLALRSTLLFPTKSPHAWTIAARCVSMFFGVAGVVVVWLFARQIASATIANLSALLYALLPVLRQNAADALSDTPHVVLYLMAVLLVVYALTRKSPALFFAAGVCSGLAFLIRPEGLGAALVAVVLALVLPSWRQQLGWRRTFAATAALSMGALLCVLPYTIASGKVSGKASSKMAWRAPRHTARNIATVPRTSASIPPMPAPAAATPKLTLIPSSAPITQMAWHRAVLEAAETLGQRLGENLRWVLLAPLVVGVIWPLRRSDSTVVQYLWALSLANVVLLVTLYCVAGYIDRRHTMPLVVLLLPSIAMGLVRIVEAAARFTIVKAYPRWAMGIALLLVAMLLAPRTLRPLHQTHQHTLAAAQVLDELASSGDTVLSNSSHVIYYATMKGKLAGGVGLRNGIPASGPTQPGGHRFAVIEQGGEQFHPTWRQQLREAYVPIATVAANAELDQNEIIIYERRDIVAVSADDTVRQ
jgi:ABC-type multidrug transport system fused ATPase/permease subunit